MSQANRLPSWCSIMPSHGLRGRLRRCPPRRSFHQSGRVQLRLGPGVAPAKLVLLLNVLVEMLHVPAHVVLAVLSQHPCHPVDRHPPSRRFAESAIDQSGKPFLLKPAPVAPELSFRNSQNLASLHCREFLALPSAQNIPKLLHPAVL